MKWMNLVLLAWVIKVCYSHTECASFVDTLPGGEKHIEIIVGQHGQYYVIHWKDA